MFKKIWVWRDLLNMSNSKQTQRDKIKQRYFHIKQQQINLEKINMAIEKEIIPFKIDNMANNSKKSKKVKNF